MKIKTFPDNPDLRKIIDDSGNVAYVLSSQEGAAIDVGSEIDIFRYQQAQTKPQTGRQLGEGTSGTVISRRNPTAPIAVKRTSGRLEHHTIADMNNCYRFCYRHNLLRHFNIPIYTTPGKELQRIIHGITLEDYIRQERQLFTYDEGARMFQEFNLAFEKFSRFYEYSDFHLGNLMYDLDAKCFVLIDFEQCSPRPHEQAPSGRDELLVHAEGRLLLHMKSYNEILRVLDSSEAKSLIADHILSEHTLRAALATIRLDLLRRADFHDILLNILRTIKSAGFLALMSEGILSKQELAEILTQSLKYLITNPSPLFMLIDILNREEIKNLLRTKILSASSIYYLLLHNSPSAILRAINSIHNPAFRFLIDEKILSSADLAEILKAVSVQLQANPEYLLKLAHIINSHEQIRTLVRLKMLSLMDLHKLLLADPTAPLRIATMLSGNPSLQASIRDGSLTIQSLWLTIQMQDAFTKQTFD